MRASDIAGMVPDYAGFALKKLTEAGFDAYFVGGCVRDGLLGRLPPDWDITTSAKPDETLGCFDGCKVILTGLRHGTVKVLVGSGAVEITTYRVDGDYSDSRHPDSVRFTDNLTGDLARRDFTMNAIAFSPASGLIDPFGGKADVGANIIRCVGDPEIRFSEDALRILRAVRFSCTLGFDIDKKTREAMSNAANGLLKVSHERVFSELIKAVCGEFCQNMAFEFGNILEKPIPELSTAEKPRIFLPGKLTGLCGLLYNIPDRAVEILTRLRCDGETIRNVRDTLELVTDFPHQDKIAMRRLMSAYRRENLENAIRLYGFEHPGSEACLALLRDEYENKSCVSLRQLAVNGNDLHNIGLEGQKIGLVLEALLDGVINEKIENEKAALLEYAVRLKSVYYD